MKFSYAYRDSQNVRHDDVIVASSRDDAFKRIRALGHRPFFVALAPGFWNRLLSVGKRGAAILLLALALAVALVVVFAREPAAPSPGFSPSAAYLALHDELEKIAESATNRNTSVSAVREKIKALFRERYPQLPDLPREREEAEALYGRVSFWLDNIESLAPISGRIAAPIGNAKIFSDHH